MNPKSKIIIIGDIACGKILSTAKLISNETSTNISVSPFSPKRTEVKISSENVLQDLVQEPYYEPKPSKFIGKPKNNFRTR